MRRITPSQSELLFNTASTRRLEGAAAGLLPPHTLMRRAGRAVSRLAQALAPHARMVWIACGPGNNGGDGLEAAACLRQAGWQVAVSWLGTPDGAPADARRSWEHACAAGVTWAEDAPHDLGPDDLCIDALLGIGLTAQARDQPPAPRLRQLLERLRHSAAPVLCVDVPSGLIADTGQFAPDLQPSEIPPPSPPSPRHTLCLLTLKPGLFTGCGRDAAGAVWLDDLGTQTAVLWPALQATARLAGPMHAPSRIHASHKGSYGDVAVIGGEGLRMRGMGMTGAALLAASAALHAGAGRVMLSLLDGDTLAYAAAQPECMLRSFEALDLAQLTVVCGCGGGTAIRSLLPQVLTQAARLVLDADALNAIAVDAGLQQLLAARMHQERTQATVLTPHPLEAARLLGRSTAEVQADRLLAANQLAERYQCSVVLKGSGSIVAAPRQTPCINPTGNARLATGGTGDVLAGLLGARLAALAVPDAQNTFMATRQSCWMHGSMADHWPAARALTASALARALWPAEIVGPP